MIQYNISHCCTEGYNWRDGIWNLKMVAIQTNNSIAALEIGHYQNFEKMDAIQTISLAALFLTVLADYMLH